MRDVREGSLLRSREGMPVRARAPRIPRRGLGGGDLGAEGRKDGEGGDLKKTASSSSASSGTG